MYYATFPVAPEVVDLSGGAGSSGTAPNGTVHELFSSLSLSSAPDGLPLLHCHTRLARPMETYLRGHVVTVYARCVTCYAVRAMWLGGAHAYACDAVDSYACTVSSSTRALQLSDHAQAL
jgi:hypothetical protein